ncbi:hypothetical_protein [Leishmania braziliensis MHOM/BR/75/M2904]|uniref:Hypothetical_protein n=1 Tax=Leishmania braziliensis MHOM/BR/75/M2904 TaxID=420245 RepID=A0A3P3ZAF1_LEIBR|nr:hypothetical_protein [Leishmania braziliensis MHOM/BR/75/M2904]
MDLGDVANSVAERFSYIKDAPSVDLTSSRHVVWGAMRARMVTSINSNALESKLEDELNDYEERSNKILMDA